MTAPVVVPSAAIQAAVLRAAPYQQDQAAWTTLLAGALRGALEALGDAEDALADTTRTGVLPTGGLTIAVADAATVAGALTEATRLLRAHASPAAASEGDTRDLDVAARYEDLARRLGVPDSAAGLTGLPEAFPRWDITEHAGIWQATLTTSPVGERAPRLVACSIDELTGLLNDFIAGGGR
jgi:hypothetical protein